MLNGMGLKKKSVLLISLILLAALAINTAVLTSIAAGRYKEAILSKSQYIGESFKKDLEKALMLGMALNTIDDLGARLKTLVGNEKSLGFAAVADSTGTILADTDDKMLGKKFEGSLTARTIKEKGRYYEMTFPLTDASGGAQGTLVLGLKVDTIKSQMYKLLRWAFVVGLLVFLGFMGLVYFASSRFITKPIVRIQSDASRIASGDLTTAVQIEGDDEIALLGNAINTLAGNLKGMLVEIHNVSASILNVTANIVSSSENVLSVADVQKKAIEEAAGSIGEMNDSTGRMVEGAGILSQSAANASSAIMQMKQSIESVSESSNIFESSTSETASSIEQMVANIRQISDSLQNLSASSEEIASSISEVNTTVKEIERHATESVSLSEKVTSSAAEKGAVTARAAMEGMESIRKSVDSLSEAINALGKRSEDIGNILTVIDEVTDQTTLLSLNAAILAAQAGESGKAFAVVADEIKSLAQRTAFSTKEISGLIKAVQEDTSASVQMVAGGIKEVEKGLKLVGDVNSALGDIAENSKTSTEMSRAIQRSTSEESNVIKQIMDAVREMTAQIENISRALQEQSRGSEFIINQTEKMKGMSHIVKSAIMEQRDGSRQIAEAAEDVAKQSGQIAQATGMQKQKSMVMVQSMDSIQQTTGKLLEASNEMNAAIEALKQDSQNLLNEILKFKI
jgi:methyl-accepting chemotaxis protein